MHYFSEQLLAFFGHELLFIVDYKLSSRQKFLEIISLILVAGFIISLIE